MTHDAEVKMDVRRIGENVCILDINGEVNAASEPVLMSAYNQSCEQGAKNIVMNFSDLAYMNSSGIGLLVTLLIRAGRQNQRLMAYGLNDHYRQIFELTRLNEVIAIYSSEAEALQALAIQPGL